MSLYDDLILDTNNGSKDTKTDGWSKGSKGIKLLAEHLLNKKQNKRDSSRKTTAVPSLPNLQQSRGGGEESSSSTAPMSSMAAVLNISYKDSKKGSLLGGEWDATEEYDPIWANDYEKIMKERKEKRQKERSEELEERERRRRLETQMQKNRSLVGLENYDDDEEEELTEEVEVEKTGGAMIAPPASLLEDNRQSNSNFGVSSVAAKIMARMGYKEGQGLGREEQGISTALSVEKTSKRGGKIVHEKDSPLMPPPPPPLTSGQTVVESITEIMKNPSKVVLLRNMVGKGEVDDFLEPETKEECGKYGEVVKVVIFELTSQPVVEEEAVRIFVEFKRVESAIKAVVDLNGRYFGGRIVRANFYDIEKFKRLELKE